MILIQVVAKKISVNMHLVTRKYNMLQGQACKEMAVKFLNNNKIRRKLTVE